MWCSKDAKREADSLLQKFVPMHVFSESSVKRMMSQDERRVTSHECSECDHQAPSISLTYSTQAGSLGTRILDNFFHSTLSAMREDSSLTFSVPVSRSSVST